MPAVKKNKLYLTANQEEPDGFLQSALHWRGSVTPRILPGLVLGLLYPLTLDLLDQYWRPLPHFDVTPFEYTGAALGLVLVFRTNSGHDRWWEARKLWGSIVNSSRNIIIASLNYGPEDSHWRQEIVKWTIAFSYAVKESLRHGKDFEVLVGLLKQEDIAALESAQHMPSFVANRISMLLQQARYNQGLGEMAFLAIENQRALLVDCVGGCERILKTPMPLVYAIKTRRFILLFLLLLPFSLIDETEVNTIFFFLLVSYPLLSLDRIGLELQYPFNERSLSHLPLNAICNTIKDNGIALSMTQGDVSEPNEKTF